IAEDLSFESEFEEVTSPTWPKIQQPIEEIPDDDEFEEEEIQSQFPWVKILSAIAAMLAIVLTGLWLFKFRLQTYDLIGLEASSVERFNDVVIEARRDHLVEFTTDGNVIWAAI